MSADLDDLLGDASRPPSDGPDADAVWAAGRRRRRWRQAGGVATAAAGVAVVGLIAVGVSAPPTPTVDPMADGAGEAEPTPDDAVGDAGESVPPPGDELPRMPTPRAPAGDDGDAGAEADDEGPDASTAPDPGPTPDAAAMADPCAAHQGREMDAFIDVVSPVAGQHVGDRIELVGCSNVPEANVRYRVLDAGGAVVVDAFTTATCGTGCVGEFRETVTGVSGEVTVEVFWESPKDASEQDLSAVAVSAG